MNACAKCEQIVELVSLSSGQTVVVDAPIMAAVTWSWNEPGGALMPADGEFAGVRTVWPLHRCPIRLAQPGLAEVIVEELNRGA